MKYLAIFNNRFVRNVVIVASGTAGAQAINLVFTPVITRLYGPEAFGVLGTFLAILAILTPLTAFSYPIAIVLPKSDDDAALLGASSVILALITSSATAMALLFFKAPIVSAFGLQSVEPYLFLLPLSMVFAAFVAVASNWIIRQKLFSISAKVAVLQSLLANLFKVVCALVFAPVAVTLIVVATMATLMHGLMLWFGVRKSAAAPPRHYVPYSVAGARALLVQHRDFAFFRTPQIVVNSIGQSLPVLMLASLFGPVAAGLYALPKTVLGVPSTLIGNSVASVFYPQFVEMVRGGADARRLLLKSCASLLGIATIAYAPVILLGPLLFSLVFGVQWDASGDYARWMALWFVATLATRPIVAAIPVLALQGMFLIFEIGSLALRALAIYAGYQFTQSSLGAVAAFSLVNVFTYGLLSFYVIRRAPGRRTVE